MRDYKALTPLELCAVIGVSLAGGLTIALIVAAAMGVLLGVVVRAALWVMG